MVQVHLAPDAVAQYGDRLVVHGFLETSSEYEDFSYRDYLARQGIYSVCNYARGTVIAAGQGSPLRSAVYRLKGAALEMVYQLWPDPEASLLAGILLGVDSGIPAEVAAGFRETGTPHIIAISGFNMVVVAGIFTTLFGRWLGRDKGMAAAVIALGLYTLLVGADPAVVRAAVMCSLALVAWGVGRRQQALHALILKRL